MWLRLSFLNFRFWPTKTHLSLAELLTRTREQDAKSRKQNARSREHDARAPATCFRYLASCSRLFTVSFSIRLDHKKGEQDARSRDNEAKSQEHDASYSPTMFSRSRIVLWWFLLVFSRSFSFKFSRSRSRGRQDETAMTPRNTVEVWFNSGTGHDLKRSLRRVHSRLRAQSAP